MEVDLVETMKRINEAAMAGKLENFGLNGVRKIAHTISVHSMAPRISVPRGIGDSETAVNKWVDATFPGLKKGQFQYVPEKGVVQFDKLGTLPDGSRAAIRKNLRNIIGMKGDAPNSWLTYKDIDFQDVETYFPHVGHDFGLAKEYLNKKLEAIVKSDGLDSDLAMSQIKAQISFARSQSPDGGHTQDFEAMLDAGEVKALKGERPYKAMDYWTPSSLKGRSQDELGLMPGWNESPKALATYGKQNIQAFHNMLFSVMANRTIAKFEKMAPLGEHTGAWASFMKLYAKGVIGQPSTIPTEFMENKEFARAINPYRYFSDQFWLDRIGAINKKFNLEPGQVLTKDDLQNIGAKEAALRKIASISNLEAKWELITLLTHTKTMVNNLVGGNLNTAIDVGFGPLHDAWSMKTVLKSMRWANSPGDVWAFVEKHGGMETFVKQAMDWNPELQTAKWSNAFSDMVEVYRKKGTATTSEDLKAIGMRHGMSEKVMEWAAKPMRITETSNRQRSWLAGYMKARTILEASDYSYKPDDPWLIQMANRTVEATQFLYNNASRPMFAQTQVGKIFTRFQLYSYNSLSFRGNILKMARQTGFREGSEEMKRFERMAMVDLFVLSMATLFPASLFDANLMEPWKTLQGVAQMLFGSDKEQKDAFFGTLPYPANIIQPISPPVTRLLYPAFNGLLTGEWDRFASYTAWTLAPFGRIAKSAAKTMENPTMVLENFAGLPVHKLTQVKKKLNLQETVPLQGPLGMVWKGF